MSRPCAEVAPARVGHLAGYLARLGPSSPVVGASRDEHALIVLAEDEDDFAGLVIDDGSGLIDGQVAVVEEHLEIAPRPPVIGAPFQNHVDIGIIGAAVHAPFGEGEHGAARADDKRWDAEAGVAVLAFAEDGDFFKERLDWCRGRRLRRAACCEPDHDHAEQQTGKLGYAAGDSYKRLNPYHVRYFTAWKGSPRISKPRSALRAHNQQVAPRMDNCGAVKICHPWGDPCSWSRSVSHQDIVPWPQGHRI